MKYLRQIWLIAMRECKILMKNRIYGFCMLVFPLLSLLFFTSLMEEGLPEDQVSGAIDAIARADMLIIGGTSLSVYPAASFVDYFHGKNLVLINKSQTSKDSAADLVIHEPIGQVLSQIKVQ